MGLNMKNFDFGDIKLGMSAELVRKFTDEDVRLFAHVTGDNNPVHLDDEYAGKSMFKKKIAHGMLSASLFSALLGTQLPGNGAIYISQSLKFKRPVYIGSTVTACVTVKSVDAERRRVVLETVGRVDGQIVVEGEAEMLVPQGES